MLEPNLSMNEVKGFEWETLDIELDECTSTFWKPLDMSAGCYALEDSIAQKHSKYLNKINYK